MRPLDPCRPSAFPERLIPGAVVGDWMLQREIGRGGMSRVFSAEHAVTGTAAAIKFLRTDVEDASHAIRILREAQVINRIQHPNVVRVLQVGAIEDGRPYLVMELLEGRTLGARIAAGRVPLHEAVEILLQICAALAAAHAVGIVHRDLKPQNVFLCAADRRVKVIDWGLAKREGDGPSDSTLAGVIFGTPRYLSPEQLRGRGVDSRTDLYALGVLAYLLVVGRPPFEEASAADLVAAHLGKEPPRPSRFDATIAPDLDALLFGLLAKSASDRPDLLEVRQVLEAHRRVAPPIARGSTRLRAVDLQAPWDPTVSNGVPLEVRDEVTVHDHPWIGEETTLAVAVSA